MTVPVAQLLDASSKFLGDGGVNKLGVFVVKAGWQDGFAEVDAYACWLQDFAAFRVGAVGAIDIGRDDCHVYLVSNHRGAFLQGRKLSGLRACALGVNDNVAIGVSGEFPTGDHKSNDGLAVGTALGWNEVHQLRQ